jgi:tRNA A37 threonylcarbamoyladenosine synthetase subunit TsaC/SUA5/YrdC
MDVDVEYFTDPEVMYDAFGSVVDIVINGGPGQILASTVIDCTGGAPVLVREGAGKWEHLF